MNLGKSEKKRQKKKKKWSILKGSCRLAQCKWAHYKSGHRLVI